jgi:glycerol-3-phosphate dehydrogenase (NAD(P)+)
MRAVGVLGAGRMGTALAQTIAGNGHPVRLWSIETEVLAEIRDRHANSKYLPGVTLHQQVIPCRNMAESLADTWLVIFSVPSHVVRSLARDAAPRIEIEQSVLNAAKGLEEGTDKRLSEVLAEELPQRRGIAAMGGPAIASEFARGVPTAVIVAAPNVRLATDIQGTLQNDFFKVETTADITGLELGACLKNAYAVALGMCDGLGHGLNTKTFLANLALGEMAALLTALGGEERTAYGLAGLADLLVTGLNPHSRNRTLGEKLCSDPDWPEFVRTEIVEGVPACRTATALADRLGVATPLLHVVHDVLFRSKPAAGTMGTFLRDFSYG